MTNIENKRKKDPNWHPDEIKLILLLYFNTDRKWKPSISDRTPEIIALSSILNKINIHPKEARSEKFRSVGSVRMKFNNIRAVDESESIDGLANVSKLDHELFEFYYSRTEDLLSECKDILAKKYKKSITDTEKPYFDIITSDKDVFDEFCRKIYESTVLFRQGAVSFKDFKLSQSAMNLSYGLLSELSKYFNSETGSCLQEPEKKSETRPDKKISDISRDVKPTAYVRKILEGIISEGISYSELKNFLSPDWSKENLGISYPLLRVVPFSSDEKKKI